MLDLERILLKTLGSRYQSEVTEMEQMQQLCDST